MHDSADPHRNGDGNADRDPDGDLHCNCDPDRNADANSDRDCHANDYPDTASGRRRRWRTQHG